MRIQLITAQNTLNKHTTSQLHIKQFVYNLSQLMTFCTKVQISVNCQLVQIKHNTTYKRQLSLIHCTSTTSELMYTKWNTLL